MRGQLDYYGYPTEWNTGALWSTGGSLIFPPHAPLG